MNSILVYGRDPEISYYYSFMLEGNFDCVATNISDMSLLNVENLKEATDLSMVVISSELEGAESIIRGLLASKLKIPLIITHTKTHRRAAKIKFKFNALSELFEDGAGPDVFLKIAQNGLKRKEKINNSKPSFCRIKAIYFKNTAKTICDIFIKLSEEKYVKVFNRFHEFSNDDLSKFLDRKAQYFYIHARDYKTFVSLMSKELTNQTPVLDNSLPAIQTNSVLTSMNCQEMVQETIDKLGLNESAIAMTNVAISSTLKLIEQGDVESMFNDVFNNGDFVGEHSLVVSYLASAICKETQWNTRENILRICLAGFFHDITLSDIEVAKVSKKDSFEFNELSRRQQSLVLAHPKKSIEIINKIEGIPIGVDTIIDFHHERYDGSGFPRGVDYKRFSPLSAIFVVAHEIADYLFDSGFVADNMEDIVTEMEIDYNRGCFKNITPVLRKVLNLQNQIKKAS